jgi:hypothetical protein
LHDQPAIAQCDPRIPYQTHYKCPDELHACMHAARSDHM